MKQKLLLIAILFLVSNQVNSQASKNSEYYKTIPDAPSEVSSGNMAGRMVDGLGFRFYWATEGLNSKDFEFRANEDSRSIGETIDHIYVMSLLIYNTISGGNLGREELNPTGKREKALENFRLTSEILKKSTDEEIEAMTINLGSENTYPIWNLINGPISDCIWHCGQIASLRRSAGNPFNSNISLLQGKPRS